VGYYCNKFTITLLHKSYNFIVWLFSGEGNNNNNVGNLNGTYNFLSLFSNYNPLLLLKNMIIMLNREFLRNNAMEMTSNCTLIIIIYIYCKMHVHFSLNFQFKFPTKLQSIFYIQYKLTCIEAVSRCTI